MLESIGNSWIYTSRRNASSTDDTLIKSLFISCLLAKYGIGFLFNYTRHFSIFSNDLVLKRYKVSRKYDQRDNSQLSGASSLDLVFTSSPASL
jgi:hypothetical protein